MPPLWLLLGTWLFVAVLALAYRTLDPDDASAADRPRWLLPGLLGLSLLALAIRAPLAVARVARNVDEYQYAAAGSFMGLSGEGFFTLPHKSFRLHLVVHSFTGGSLAWIDVVTSLAVAATALMLGLAVWRGWRRPLAALVAVTAYALGILRFEGLSSNAEPFANLFLAGYLLSAVGASATPTARAQLLRGALLGLVALSKEQTLPLLALEPLRLLVPLLRVEDRADFDWRGTARSIAWAVAGSLAPIALVLIGFAVHGHLGSFLSDLAHWGTQVGDTGDAAHARPGLLTSLAVGYRRVVLGPVGLLGVVALAAQLSRWKTLTPAYALLCTSGLLSLGVVALGLRWHGHYYQLAFPALSILAALALDGCVRGLRARRWQPAVVVLAAVAVAALEVSLLASRPRLAQGKEIHSQASYAATRGAAASIARLTPPREPIYVWGWRPDLYRSADRPAASGYVAFTARFVHLERLLGDLERHPPAAFVVTPACHDARNPSALVNQPRVQAWLTDHGFIPARRVSGYTVWLPLEVR